MKNFYRIYSKLQTEKVLMKSNLSINKNRNWISKQIIFREPQVVIWAWIRRKIKDSRQSEVQWTWTKNNKFSLFILNRPTTKIVMLNLNFQFSQISLRWEKTMKCWAHKTKAHRKFSISNLKETNCNTAHLHQGACQWKTITSLIKAVFWQIVSRLEWVTIS